MKRNLLLTAILATTGLVHAQSACGSSAKYCTPVQAYGRLRAMTVGGKGGIYDSSGTRQVVLRGMSMYWSSEPSGYKFFNSGVVQTLQKDFNVSVIRVPVAVEKAPNSASTNVGYVDDSGVTTNRALAVVYSAITQGLYVIIDWHCYDAVHEDKALPFFRSMAAKFKNTPNVIFEIWNEPISGDVTGYATRIIAAIRATGNKNLVIMGSGQWSSQPNTVGAPTDAASNVAYTLHFYSSESSHAAYVNTNMTDAVNNKGRAVFATEWGATTADGNSGYSWPTSLLSTVESYKVSTCNWTVGNQLSDPNNTSSGVQGSAALQTTASANGSWTDAMLTQDGKDAKSWISGKNAGLFTLPDTSLAVLNPLASDSDSVLVGASTTLNIQFNKAVTASFKLTGLTSGAYWTTSVTSDTVGVAWSSTKKALASVAFTPGETIQAQITNLSTLPSAKLTTTFVLRKSTGIERSRQVTAFGWSEQGLRLPLGTVSAGETYRVRVLDLQGRQVGETRQAQARSIAGQISLDLPAVHGSGMAIVELQGDRGPVVRAVLPPVRD
jgi:endoglucanase